MKIYVVGYLFSSDLQRVVLIRKTHPAWQAGKLNGVGGRVESESILQAMVREFGEETDLLVEEWKQYAVLTDEDLFSVHYFWSVDKTLEDSQISSPTDEKAGWISVAEALGTKEATVANLLWLIPMALNDILRKDVCTLFKIVEKQHVEYRHD